MARDFANHFPNLVEKYKIQYPLNDEILKVMPRLHSSTTLPPRPPLKQILLKMEEFEKLLCIWEFFNTFSDFLKIPQFKLEEIEAALRSQNKSPEDSDDPPPPETIGLLQTLFNQSVTLLSADLRERHYKHLKENPDGSNPEKSEL